MNPKNVALIIFWACTVIVVYFFIYAGFKGYWIWSSHDMAFDKTGQVGDFIGGVIGTIISGAAFYFLYLTLQEQLKASKGQALSFERERFEATFFEIISFHRNNVSETTYTKFEEGRMQTANGRKVYRMILKEFVECRQECLHYSPVEKITSINDVYLPDYLAKIRKRFHNASNEKAIELAYINIAYVVVYYGLGDDWEFTVKKVLKSKYRETFFLPILKYLRLKPKREYGSRFVEWRTIYKMEYTNMREMIDTYNKTGVRPAVSAIHPANGLFSNIQFMKYYGGHQHRLGHYFRHLFQAYTFLNNAPEMSDDKKYDYGKMLRAQLSTYEQFLLFVNSLSSLGQKWEYCASENDKLITKYHLIKNLPGAHLYSIVFKKYYPNVKYEEDEQD